MFLAISGANIAEYYFQDVLVTGFRKLLISPLDKIRASQPKQISLRMSFLPNSLLR